MTTYGICYGTNDTTIIECESLEAARTLAQQTLSDTVTSVDIVELEGAGPVCDSDGEQIADTHAPARVLDTMRQVSVSAAAAALGRKGGSARTPAQQEARRKNGAQGGRPALPFVVVRTAFHRGGLVSRHRTREAAEAARHRFAARDCTCGCAVVVTREEYEALPGANDARSPYAPARRTTSH